MRALAIACLSLLCTSAQAQDLAVRAERLHTVAGPVITDGVVLIRAGKIAAVGPADASTFFQEVSLA